MKFRPVSSNAPHRLKIAGSPFTHNRDNTSAIMLWVVIAMIPGVAAQLWFFGIGTLLQVLIAVMTALVTESIAVRLRNQPVMPYLKDNSALVTAVLLAVSIPPLAPWWMIVVGTFFAVIIAKHLYGGLGQNPFNPAMVGYVVLLISFPVQMTSWLPPESLQIVPVSVSDSLHVIFTGLSDGGLTLEQLRAGADGMSQATPLDSFKTGLLTREMSDILTQPVLQGSVAGIGWQWVNIGYLIGGCILLNRKVIAWQIPAAMLGTLAVLSAIGYIIDSSYFTSPVVQLFSGASMLGAFFIATDPVTASTTPRGRLIYGMLIGLLLWIIRVYGGYPDAVAFAVLLANITVPLIDTYTQPRVYGHNRGNK